MPFLRFPLIALTAAFLFTGRASAKAVISEVHWAGSDLSTSDEWVEVGDSGSGSGTGSGDGTDVGGWTLTSVNSSSIEIVLFIFPTNARISINEYLVVSHFGAAQSRLLSEPAFVTNAMSLPNTKLLLRLRDPSGQVMDQVDDGSGNPFAGTNATNPVLKASMERIDLAGAGDDPGNWMTAVRSQGFDQDAPMLGTPGFPRAAGTSASSTSPAFSSSSISSFSSSSCPALDPYFILQSGATSGVDKVTLNIQIGTHRGSLTGASCTVDFDDGTLANTCNPPSHTYDEPGTYTITAEVKNSCGTVTRTLPVSVMGASSSSSVSASAALPVAPLPSMAALVAGNAPFVITGVLPNPAGKDPGSEWVEIRNVSGQTASLEGWTLRLPHAKKTMFTFGSVSFFLHESKRFSDRDLGMTFGNAAGELSLIHPAGVTVQTLTWKDAREGITYAPDRPTALPAGPVTATVTRVVDGDTLDVKIHGGGSERVRLIGIDAPELFASDVRQMMLGRRAAEFLRDRIERQTVTLEVGSTERDAYGRLLAYATTAQGDGLQEILLREGMASVELRFQFSKEAEFIGYQREAQDSNAGMWGIIGGNSSPFLASLPGGFQGVQRSPFGFAQGRQGPVGEEFSQAGSFLAFSSSSRTSSSRSRSSSSKKSSSKRSAARRATTPRAAVPKPPVVYRNIIDDLPEEIPEDGPNFSPLHDDFRALQMLVEDLAASSSATSTWEVPAVEHQDAGFPFIILGIALTGTAAGSGVLGWLLARRRK